MYNKELMAEAAILYYEKGLTQQEIAKSLYLSRQTVSKLLTEAIQTNVVEIKIHHPKKQCAKLQESLQSVFGIEKAIVCSATSKNNSIRQMMTIKAATEYILPLIKEGNKNIATSWGRTIQQFIAQCPNLETKGNRVYPLFGATDHEEACFSSNELARSFADKINATVKYAWFPYLPDNETDKELFQKTTYYNQLCALWNCIDIAIVGIGNSTIIDLFAQTFEHTKMDTSAVGDIATHFFDIQGNILNLYSKTLCASTDNLKNTKNVIAIACGDDKISAIKGALLSKLINVIITDEHTAKELLKYVP